MADGKILPVGGKIHIKHPNQPSLCRENCIPHLLAALDGSKQHDHIHQTFTGWKTSQHGHNGKQVFPAATYPAVNKDRDMAKYRIVLATAQRRLAARYPKFPFTALFKLLSPFLTFLFMNITDGFLFLPPGLFLTGSVRGWPVFPHLPIRGLRPFPSGTYQTVFVKADQIFPSCL